MSHRTKVVAQAAAEIGITPVRASGPPHAPPEEREFKKGHPRWGGRAPGTPNRISKTMKDAVIAAVELLGSTDLDKWEEIIKKAKDDPDPFRRYFTITAVKSPHVFMAVVGKLIPTHIIHSPAQRYMTEEAAREALTEAGIPLALLDYMPTIDLDEVDPDEIVGHRKSLYPDPELDEGLRDVTPKQDAAE